MEKRIHKLLLQWTLISAMLFVVAACRDDKELLMPETEDVDDITESRDLAGFYLLNEGNMGSNKATLDYFDFASGQYTRNIYAEANQTVVQELGDVGNDLNIYGSRLYAVINCSNFVEVMDVHTARHIGTIEVPNCRYMAFSGRYAYLTSYAGPVLISTDYKQIGYVAKIDTATLQVVATCNVGFQPDGIAVDADGGKIYVANSGGYMVPNYENTVSVIDIETFTEERRIEVVNNLHRLCIDSHKQLWVSSRGDYFEQPSRLYCVDLQTESLCDSVDVAVGSFWLDGDSLYVCSNEFSYETYDNTASYAIVDVKHHTVVTRNFITDGTDERIQVPYGICVNPLTKDIFVTDARNYVSPGVLYCFDKYGKKKWSVSTGDIPAHFALHYK